MSVPRNLEECYVALDEMKIQDLDSWLNQEENAALGMSHFGLGMWIRNNWDLWATQHTPPWENSLSDYFNNIGIKHPNDMSGIILTSYHRHKNGKDIKLEEQVKHYQDFWKKQNKKK
jgi:hypothetical protein